jgi:heme exporter protein A
VDLTQSTQSHAQSALLTASNLSCVKQDRVLFEQLSLQLHPGQLLQIKGKNGAGKSSLLRILAGLARADEGELYYQGQAITQSRVDYATNLCFIGHQSGIHEQLTALENLRFWRAACDLTPADDLALLASLGLAGLEDIPCRMLSAGQQRRVSLARLWTTKAQIWILDEPFTALDQSAIATLQQHFVTHLEQGGAIILTTHQPLSLQYAQLFALEIHYRW